MVCYSWLSRVETSGLHLNSHLCFWLCFFCSWHLPVLRLCLSQPGIFWLKKKNPGGRVHGWSALHGFHSLQHNSGIKKLHTERWILNNYVDSVYRDMPSLAAEALMLCFMWLLHSIEEASWTPQQAPEIFQGPFQYPTSPLPQEVLRGMVKTEGCWGLQRKFMCFNRV